MTIQLAHNNVESLDANQGKQMIFVYGTLMKGQRAHDYLINSKFIGRCSIEGVMVHLGGYPGLVQHPHCRVTGEVYEVNWDTLVALDRYESCPSLYHRRQIKTPLGNCWTYYKNGVDSLGEKTKVVDRGVWTDGISDRTTFGELLDYFINKRYLEPKFRVGPQPIIPAEITKTHEEQIKDAVAKGESNVILLPLKKDEATVDLKEKKPVEVKVGPGTELL